jgi:hypothetical protein
VVGREVSRDGRADLSGTDYHDLHYDHPVMQLRTRAVPKKQSNLRFTVTSADISLCCALVGEPGSCGLTVPLSQASTVDPV